MATLFCVGNDVLPLDLKSASLDIYCIQIWNTEGHCCWKRVSSCYMTKPPSTWPTWQKCVSSDMIGIFYRLHRRGLNWFLRNIICLGITKRLWSRKRFPTLLLKKWKVNFSHFTPRYSSKICIHSTIIPREIIKGNKTLNVNEIWGNNYRKCR